jgi:hypothetical protein
MHGIRAKVNAAGPFHAAGIGIAGGGVEDGQFGQFQQDPAPGHLGAGSVLQLQALADGSAHRAAGHQSFPGVGLAGRDARIAENDRVVDKLGELRV